MEAPYGSWTIARRRAADRRGRGRPRLAAGRRRGRLLGRDAPPGGRPIRDRAARPGREPSQTSRRPASTPARWCTSTAAACTVAFLNESGGESVVFSDFADQRLYRQDLEPGSSAARRAERARAAARWSAPRPITPAPPAPRAWRYADGDVSPDGRLLVCVRERHEEDGVVNDLVALPADGARAPVRRGRRPRLLRRTADQPRRRPSRLSVLGPPAHAVGRHRAAPRLRWTRRAAAAPRPSSPAVRASRSSSPPGRPHGDLHFVSDRNGWWNLYRSTTANGRDDRRSGMLARRRVRQAPLGVRPRQPRHAARRPRRRVLHARRRRPPRRPRGRRLARARPSTPRRSSPWRAPASRVADRRGQPDEQLGGPRSSTRMTAPSRSSGAAATTRSTRASSRGRSRSPFRPRTNRGR